MAVDDGVALDERVASNSFQMSLQVASGTSDVVTVAISQLAAWLRTQKRWDAPLDDNGFQHQKGHDRDLLTLHRESSDGRDFRARLTERTPKGIWRSQLTVHEPSRGRSWVALQVENSNGRWTAVPRLATFLLDALPLMDGSTPVSSESQVVGPGNVDEFLDQLCDQERRGLFYVAGTNHDDIDFTAFSRQVAAWAQQVRGLAQVAVLAPEATGIVAAALGREHAIAPWTLRTFYPDVDPALDADGRRHRFVTTARLARERDNVIRDLLGRIARRHAYLRSPFDGWTAADRALRRLEDKTLIEPIAALLPPMLAVQPTSKPPEQGVETAVIEAPEDVVEPAQKLADPLAAEHIEGPSVVGSELLAELETTRQHLATLESIIDMVQATLRLTEITPEALANVGRKATQSEAVAETVKHVQAELAVRAEREADLEVRLNALQEAFDDAQLDQAVSSGTAAKLQDENRYLKQRLAEVSDYEAAYGAVPAEAYTKYPNDFADLHARLGEVEAAGVVFTGDADEMLGLDEHDTLGNCVRVAWDALLALADYLRARSIGDCNAGVRDYLRETPQGYRSMASNKFGGKETKVTMQRWGDLREFPVPGDVAASGRVPMEAHFKLGSIGMVSPRMYYLDAYGTTGKVYVGYIGAHLRNTMTN